MEVYESKKSGSHKYLGVAQFTLLELLERRTTELEIVHKERTNCVIVVGECLSVQKHTFLDFIFGGCDIQLVLAIDFTQSNGDPKTRNSLHYLDMSNRFNKTNLLTCRE